MYCNDRNLAQTQANFGVKVAMGKNVAVYGRLTLRPRAPRIIVISKTKGNDTIKSCARAFLL